MSTYQENKKGEFVTERETYTVTVQKERYLMIPVLSAMPKSVRCTSASGGRIQFEMPDGSYISGHWEPDHRVDAATPAVWEKAPTAKSLSGGGRLYTVINLGDLKADGTADLFLWGENGEPIVIGRIKVDPKAGVKKLDPPPTGGDDPDLEADDDDDDEDL